MQSYLDVFASAIEVETAGVGVIVPVASNLHAGVLEDGGVITP